jgi:hypothetical protein
MIGRIINQPDADFMLVRKVDQSFRKLAAEAIDYHPVVLIDGNSMCIKPGIDHWPKIL